MSGFRRCAGGGFKRCAEGGFRRCAPDEEPDVTCFSAFGCCYSDDSQATVSWALPEPADYGAWDTATQAAWDRLATGSGTFPVSGSAWTGTRTVSGHSQTLTVTPGNGFFSISIDDPDAGAGAQIIFDRASNTSPAPAKCCTSASSGTATYFGNFGEAIPEEDGGGATYVEDQEADATGSVAIIGNKCCSDPYDGSCNVMAGACNTEPCQCGLKAACHRIASYNDGDFTAPTGGTGPGGGAGAGGAWDGRFGGAISYDAFGGCFRQPASFATDYFTVSGVLLHNAILTSVVHDGSPDSAYCQLTIGLVSSEPTTYFISQKKAGVDAVGVYLRDDALSSPNAPASITIEACPP